MSKCDGTDRYREVVFEQGGRQLQLWARDRLRLGQSVKILDRQGLEGDWFVRALTTNTLCSAEMHKKAQERPSLYPLVETS
jgi:hypothetical protein